MEGQAVRKGTVVGKLFSEIGPRYLDRPGGYTRIVRLSLRRLGDNGQLVLLQLVGEDEKPEKQAKTSDKKRSRKKSKKAEQAQETAKVKESLEADSAAEDQKTVEAQDTENKDDKS